MFDTHFHHRGPAQVSVDVTEKRAPTDESVRLLREMEQAAQQKVDQTIRLENCPIDCVVQVHHDLMNDQCEYRMLAKVGGKRIEAVKTFDLKGKLDMNTLATGLVQALAEKLAIELLAPAFRSSGHKFLRG